MSGDRRLGALDPAVGVAGVDELLLDVQFIGCDADNGTFQRQ